MAQGPHYRFYGDFSGGVNDTVSDIRVSPREATKARNVDLSRDGAVTKRKGAVRQNGSSAQTGEVGMVFQFLPTGLASRLVVAVGQTIQEWDGANGWTVLQSGLTANQVVLPVPFRHLLYLFNNSNNPMVYWPGAPSSPYIFRPGAPAPGVLTDAGDIAGSVGSPGHKFRVRIRFVSAIDAIDFGEPYPDEGVEITLGASGGRRLTIPTYPHSGTPFDYRINRRIVERTTAGVSPGAYFYLDGYVNDNSTTTYDITQADSALLENELMPDVGFRNSMPSLWPAIQYKQRIVGADPTDLGKIRWSEIDEFGLLPNAFVDGFNEQYLDIEDAGDAPVMVLKFGEYLAWYCGRSVHLMHIDEGGVADVRRVGGHALGFPSPRAGVELPGLGHLVWSYKGPYFFTGELFIPAGERIERTLGTIPKGQLAAMFALHRSQEDRRQVVFVMPGPNSVENNLAAKYHYRRVTLNPEGFPTQHAWTFDDNFAAKSGTIALDSANSEIEYVGDYDGRMFRRDLGESDQQHPGGSESIEAEYRTGWLDMDLPHQVKTFEDVWVIVSGEGANIISLEWETGFGAGPSGSAELELVGDQALWDTAVWDTAVWALGESVVRHAKMGVHGINAWGRYIRFRWANYNAGEPWQVVGMIVKYSIDRDRDDASE